MYPNRLFADVSTNNAHYDAKQYAEAGHILIAIKATEGIAYVNPSLHPWSTQSIIHHTHLVLYHFARPDLDNDPEQEADHFIDHIGRWGPAAACLVVDIERAAPSGWSHDPQWSRRFQEQVRHHYNGPFAIYASRSILEQSDGWLTGEHRYVWEADWSDAPNYAPHGYECLFRQYTDGVHGPEPHVFGGVGRCDGNIMSRRLFDHLMEHRPCPVY